MSQSSYSRRRKRKEGTSGSGSTSVLDASRFGKKRSGSKSFRRPADDLEDEEQPSGFLGAANVLGAIDEEQSDNEEGENYPVHVEITICFHVLHSTIAAAYFDPETKVLQILEDTKDTPEYDLAALILDQIKPLRVIISSKTVPAFVDMASKWCDQYPPAAVRVEHARTFAAGPAAAILTRLRLPDGSALAAGVSQDENIAEGIEPEMASSVVEGSERIQRDDGTQKTRLAMVRLGCWVNMDAEGAIGATAALLVLHERQGLQLGEDGLIEVNAIEALTPNEYMKINRDALLSLNVFDNENYVNSNRKAASSTFTLFNMLNTCVTPAGKKLLQTWMFRPLMDIEQIKLRHDAVALFVTPEGRKIAENTRKALYKVKSVAHYCLQLSKEKGSARYQTWKGIEEAILGGLELKDTLQELGEAVDHPFLQRVMKSIGGDLHYIAHEITQTIDWDACRTDTRIIVRPGVDDELDFLKEQWVGLDETMAAVAQMIGTPFDFCGQILVRYFPQMGFLIEASQRERDVPPPADWELSFESDNEGYYKTPEMKNLDVHYGDIFSNMADTEAEIIRELAKRVSAYDHLLLEAVNAIAVLDCILAYATAAISYDLVRPAMHIDPVLSIERGWHVIHEAVIGRYIKNDTLLHGGQHEAQYSMMVITGANGSGKSAYGKQVALIVFMAQIGCFVPAERATIGVVDKLFTRIQTRESTSKDTSAFMIDLSQVSLALRGCTIRSLIILDEFGKGTNSIDGASLLAAVLSHLLETVRPRTLCMTHFHELFSVDSILMDLPIQFCHMRTTLSSKSEYGIAYLYELVPDLESNSYAAECALIHQVPPAIVERARFVTECVATHQIGKLHDVDLTEEEREDLKDAEELARRFLTWNIKPDSIDVIHQLKEIIEDRAIWATDDEDGSQSDEDTGHS